MFKMSEIKELIKLIDQSSLQELEIESEGSRLLIRKPNKTETLFVNAAPQAYTQAYPTAAALHHQQHAPSLEPHPGSSNVIKEMDSTLHTIVSPMVGTFYQSSSPGSTPFVSVGAKVGVKTAVCIIEAMKLMNEIEAEVNGEIVEILVENGQLVEYGQPLFMVKPE
jgi:acetyl-CoA carboxylase biotin carboxyl carrier protein